MSMVACLQCSSSISLEGAYTEPIEGHRHLKCCCHVSFPSDPQTVESGSHYFHKARAVANALKYVFVRVDLCLHTCAPATTCLRGSTFQKQPGKGAAVPEFSTSAVPH